MTSISQELSDIGIFPTTTDPDNFDIRADAAFGVALPRLRTELITWTGQVNTVAGEVNSFALLATTKADEAAASAAAALLGADAAKWVSGTTYAEGDVVWSPLNRASYRRIIAGAGTTDPSEDGVNWDALQQQLLQISWADRGLVRTAVPVDGDLIFIETMGLYRFEFGSAAVDDDLTVFATSAGRWLLKGRGEPLTADITVTIGSGGDFPSLQAAAAYLDLRSPVCTSAMITGTMHMLPDYVMTEPILVFGKNLGWTEITQADGETPIVMSGITVDVGSSLYPCFYAGAGGTLPKISAYFSMDTSGVGGRFYVGVYVDGAGSHANISTGKGVILSPFVGLLCSNAATASADGAIFSGAGVYGILSKWGAVINAINADAGMTGTPAMTDFVVQYGGKIIKHGGIGGVSQDVNMPTINGIIYG